MKLLMYILFYFGDFWSKYILDYLPFTYQIYNKCMIWSCEISDKYNYGLWKDAE